MHQKTLQNGVSKKKLWRSQLNLKCDNPFLSVPGAQNKQPWYKAWRPTWKSINQRMSELKQTPVMRLWKSKSLKFYKIFELFNPPLMPDHSCLCKFTPFLDESVLSSSPIYPNFRTAKFIRMLHGNFPEVTVWPNQTPHFEGQIPQNDHTFAFLEPWVSGERHRNPSFITIQRMPVEHPLTCFPQFVPRRIKVPN